MGIDPANRRLSSGGHPGWAIPHGTSGEYDIALIQGWAKAQRAVPTSSASTITVGALRFAHPTPSYPTIPAATWPRRRSKLSSVFAQASATSTPLVAKCLRRKS